MPEKWLRPAEVSARINVTAKTLANWRARKKGPPCIDFGGCHRYPESELEKWIERQRWRGDTSRADKVRESSAEDDLAEHLLSIATGGRDRDLWEMAQGGGQ